MNARVTQWMKRPQSPLLAAAALLVLAWLFIRPWGDFGLNDDWTFALVAKGLLENGTIQLRAPSSPNAVGMGVLGAGLLKVTGGFSHLTLRLFTMALTLAGLWAIHGLLRQAVRSPWLRLGALVVLAFNPIVFNMATSFMTELHGWFPAMLGAWLWFWAREKAPEDERAPLVPFWVSTSTGLLIGLVFWTRQISVVVYPAVIGATLLRVVATGQGRRVLRTLPGLVVGTVLFGVAIATYVPWAKATGNFRPEFAERIGHLTEFQARNFHMQSGALLVYMTAAFLPLLLLVPWRKGPGLGLEVGALLILALTLSARARFSQTAPSDFWVGPIWTHKVFPYLLNIVNNAGVGPITTDDGFFYDVKGPTWSKEAWGAIEVLLLAAGLKWSPLAARLPTLWREGRSEKWLEVAIFAVLLTLGSTVAIVQVHQMELLDRYHVPVILALALLVPIVIDRTGSMEGPAAGLVARFALPCAALIVFVVGGMHDYFRWQEARWALFDQARAAGGTRVTIQGGYEMNCYWMYDGLKPEERICGASCRCVMNSFCCADDEWRIGFSVPRGYSQISALQPRYLLADGPPVVLARRPR
jgi:hypothetical protein